MTTRLTRRDALCSAAFGTAALLASGCDQPSGQTATPASMPETTRRPANPSEEYVWISANANLPLFAAHEHPALRLVGEELGVKVTIAGPNSLDIPALVAAIEQTVVRKPAGIMVVGWDPSELIPPINAAMQAGVPVVCVDSDVPRSNRYAFIGTNWRELGAQHARLMLKALGDRKGKVALLGSPDLVNHQQAFEGFRSVAEPAGLTVMDPQSDKGIQAEAEKVTTATIEAEQDLVGIAGFGPESGPGMGRAIKDAGKGGTIMATATEAEPQHLRLVEEGILTATVGQKRELFTYQGVKALYELKHSPLRFTNDDRRTGIAPIPVFYDTGTYTVTRENVALFLRT